MPKNALLIRAHFSTKVGSYYRVYKKNPMKIVLHYLLIGGWFLGPKKWPLVEIAGIHHCPLFCKIQVHVVSWKITPLIALPTFLR